MTHNDPTLWAEYSAIAKELEAFRLRGFTLARAEGFPSELMVKAGLLTYHLRAAYGIAVELAGEKPVEVSG